MEKITKELKLLSKGIGIIGLYQLFNMVDYIMSASTLDVSTLDAMSQSMLPVVKVVGAVPFALSALVHVILCFKGHQEANDPSPAKFHIILAVLWTIGYALSTIGAVAGLFDGVTMLGISDLLFSAAATVMLFFYSKYAKEIRTAE